MQRLQEFLGVSPLIPPCFQWLKTRSDFKVHQLGDTITNTVPEEEK